MRLTESIFLVSPGGLLRLSVALEILPPCLIPSPHEKMLVVRAKNLANKELQIRCQVWG